MKKRFLPFALALLAFLPAARAQWLTQTVELKAGWNAVFLHVDASYATLDALIGGDVSNPIQEIWRWNPPSAAQYTDSPQNPNAGSEWTSWVRGQSGGSAQRAVGDTAYLVRVSANVSSYQWNLKGRPVAPRNDWTLSGLNFVGFPTVPVNPPKFDAFLAAAPELQSITPEIYYYPGGELSTNNPTLLPKYLFRLTPVKRGQAFWIRSGDVFNHYFGPFSVQLSGAGGVDFQDSLGTYSLRLRNLTTNRLTVNLQLLNSEAPPAGQSPIVALPPLLVRGALNLTNLSYAYAPLTTGSPHSWTLEPRGQLGEETEVVLGLNRSAITQPAGSLLAGLLRFTDGLGFSQIDAPVTAQAAARSGLWIGSASVNQVQHALQSFARDAQGQTLTGQDGRYVVASSDSSMGSVPQPFPLRLIVHNPDSGSAVLLQRVFYGMDSKTNPIIARAESALGSAFLRQARRISSLHLPWTANNTAWTFNSRLGADTNLFTTVVENYNDRASNPFLHGYHPDHDNLDAGFKNILPQGSESYTIERLIRLQVTPPADDFASLVEAGKTLAGNYSETITLKGLARGGGKEDTRQIQVQGRFTLSRVSPIAQLTAGP